MSIVISVSSRALGFGPKFDCVVVRASSKASVSLLRGRLSLVGSSFSCVPGVQGLGNFPGQSLGIPLFPVLPRLPSLSITCEPKDTVFRPLFVVPGVINIPPGCLEGDDGGVDSLGAGNSTALTLVVSMLFFLSVGLETLCAFSGAGVPKIACLNAFTAN